MKYRKKEDKGDKRMNIEVVRIGINSFDIKCPNCGQIIIDITEAHLLIYLRRYNSILNKEILPFDDEEFTSTGYHATSCNACMLPASRLDEAIEKLRME